MIINEIKDLVDIDFIEQFEMSCDHLTPEEMLEKAIFIITDLHHDYFFNHQQDKNKRSKKLQTLREELKKCLLVF